MTQLSLIDEKWGRLFDERGLATARLEQVLRGLANYIVSLVLVSSVFRGPLITIACRSTSSCLRRASS